MIDKCFSDCYNNSFHNFKYRCIYDFKPKNITNKEKFNLPISDKSMHLYDLNNKLTVAREKGFWFLHLKKLTKNLFAFTIYKQKFLSGISNTDVSWTIF